MLRSPYRWLVWFFLTLVLLLGCQGERRGTAIDPGEPEPVSATLTSRRIKPGGSFIWWEAENPVVTNFPPLQQNPFAPANPTEAAALSEGKWIGVADQRAQPLFLEYQVRLPEAADYFFYARKFWQHGPFRWRWDDQPWQAVGSNVYLMDEVGLRQFVVANWVSLGQVSLAAGTHTLRLELTELEGAAAFDCFVLTRQAWQPRGKLKPDERYHSEIPGWFVFDPERDSFRPTPIDLRALNEAFAGEQGRIQVRGEGFIHAKTGQPERFWAVNTGTGSLQMQDWEMAYLARSLAKRGVNLVRLHGPLWGKDWRKADPQTLQRVFALVAALKKEGIYTGLSIYFPMWLKLQAADGFPGYSGQNPVSLLFFNHEFQEIYYGWWRSLLTTVNPLTGQTLAADPAIAMVELVNEDSYLFWTFEPYKSVPAAQMERLEKQFGAWLTAKYGSLELAAAAWTGYQLNPERGDRPLEGRLGLPAAGELAAQKDSRRAQDAAAFLTQNQSQFFQAAIGVLRQELGYGGLIYASNWITADAQTLGPLDKYSNTVADFIDRHGYFAGVHTGDAASYALTPGDTYRDRSALLFSGDNGKLDFNLPLADIHYNGLPSTITEVNWPMPNRFRADFPLLVAAYGALQGSDGFCFFALDKPWEAVLGKFPVATPALLGQFPATALLYRKGLLREGTTVADVPLKVDDLLSLRGAPVMAPQNLDAFRAQDVPAGQVLQTDRPGSIDPLSFAVGKVNLRFVPQAEPAKLLDLSNYIDRDRKTLRSSTGELFWNYDRGLVTVNAPQVQGITGFLKSNPAVQLSDLHLQSAMPYGTVVLVALDNQPIARSGQMLLQVMSEEQNFGWKTSGYPGKKIESKGTPPLTIRNLQGQVSLQRSDAAQLKVTELDSNGYRGEVVGRGDRFDLRPQTLYYLLEK